MSETKKRKTYKKKAEAPALRTNRDKVDFICKKNNFPFKRGDYQLGRTVLTKDNVPDFICRERRLVIEVDTPGRLNQQERVNLFYKCDYRVLFLTSDNLKKSDWEQYCTGAIRGFIG